MKVVSAYQQPKHCNGKHNFSFSFTIVDPLQYPLPEGSPSSEVIGASEPLVIQCFADSIESFPPIRRVGDLVRLHRCNLQMYQNRPQILWFHQKSSYLLFSHPLVDELIGLPFEGTSVEVQTDGEINELKLEEFSSSETYHIDEQVERDYIHFLSLWKVAYFISTGYSDTIPKSLVASNPSGGDPNKFFHVSLRKMKEIVSSVSSLPASDLQNVNISSMDFIGMFVGLFPSSSSENEHNQNRYLYVWDGSGEGGIHPSTSPIPRRLSANEYLKTTPNIYDRIELSVKIILQYNEILIQLLKSTSSTLTSTIPAGTPFIESITLALHESLSQLLNERNNVSPPPDPNTSRYLPGGFGILAIPPSCVCQLGMASSLRPGTWIRARKIVSGSIEEIPHLQRNEIVCARLTVGSSINVLPPFHWSTFPLDSLLP